MKDKSNAFYTTGGTVITGVYIERDADHLLLENCLRGDFSAILTSRQMGKTSLMYRTRAKLEEKNIHVATIDLHLIGETDIEDQWFPSFLSIIAEDLEVDVNVGEWWEEHKHFTPINRMVTFLYKEIVLKKEFPIVIFIDEIEGIRGRTFANDFFAAIRAIYNDRNKHPKIQNLSFVFLGCVLPYQLISDSRKTSYNIGNFINLTDFTINEALPLLGKLNIEPGLDNQVMEWIFEWTGGQPYLTQMVCNELYLDGKYINRREQIDDAIAKLLSSEEYKGKHLKYLQTWLADPKSGERMLRTYGYILENTTVFDQDKNQTLNELKLIGVIKLLNGRLVVRNKIYRHSINRDWVVNELTRGGAAVPQDFSKAKLFLEESIGNYDNKEKDELPDWLSSIGESFEESDQMGGLEQLIDSIIESTLTPSSNEEGDINIKTKNSSSKTTELQDFFIERYRDTRFIRSRFLVRADIPLNNLEFILFALGLLLFPITLSYLLIKNLYIGVLLSGVGLICLLLVVTRKQTRRLTEFNQQLPTMLNLMVNSLRAGYSTMQAMEAISINLHPPISDEFRRVVQEMQLGVPMEQTLENLKRRIPSDELALIITAINIQREVGGNLSEILDTISYTIRDKLRIKGEMHILENLPFWFYYAFIVLMTVIQWIIFPGYFELFWENPIGRISVGLAYLGLSIIIILIGVSSQRMDRMYKRMGSHLGRIRNKQIFMDGFGSGLILLTAVLLGVPWYIQIWLVLLLLTRYWFGTLVSGISIGIIFYQITSYSNFNFSEWLNIIWLRIEPWALLINKTLFSFSQKTGSTISIWFIVVCFTIIFGLLVFLFSGNRLAIKNQLLQTKLEDFFAKGEIINLDKLELSLPVKDRFIDPGIKSIKVFISRFFPKEIYKSTQKRIYQANLPSFFSPWVIYIFQVISSVFLNIILLYAISQMNNQWSISIKTIFIAFATIFGVMLPQIWITFRIKAQNNQLLSEFPDALDLLVMCVEAGLGLDTAITKVCEKWESKFSSIFTHVINDIQSGKLRWEAFKSLEEKLDIAEISSFVAAVIQSEKLGASTAKVFRIQSDQTRITYRQQIELEVNRIQKAKQLIILLLAGPVILLWFIAPVLSQIISIGYK